jgi:hypothetical protein
MARFVQLQQYPAEHGGVTRIARGFAALGSFSATRAVLHSLSTVGSPLTRAWSAWSAARKQRRDDEQLWNLALSDARIMADLSRAMSQDALRDGRGYF